MRRNIVFLTLRQFNSFYKWPNKKEIVFFFFQDVKMTLWFVSVVRNQVDLVALVEAHHSIVRLCHNRTKALHYVAGYVA